MSDLYNDTRDGDDDRTPPRALPTAGSGRNPPPLDDYPAENYPAENYPVDDDYPVGDAYDSARQPTAPQRPVNIPRTGPQAAPLNTGDRSARVSRVTHDAPPPPRYDRDLYDEPRRGQPARNAPRRPAKIPVDKRGSGLYLPWWSLLIMLMFVGGAAAGAWIIVSQLGGSNAPGGGTPQVIVITATYTIGAPATQASISGPATPTATLPLPTIAASLTLPPGEFKLGGTVRVIGTGVGGMNVRPSPSLDTVPKFQAPEGTTFVLKEGPVFASNTEWWRVEDPNDPSITGWGARNFLEPIS